VVVHAGHAPVGTEHTGPGPFGAVLARHRRLVAIIAHMGAPDYAEFAGLAGLGLGDAWLRAVCWENPVALFGTPLPQPGG
jgi:hypothetical protein